MVNRFLRITLVTLITALPVAVFAQVGNPSGGNDSVTWDITARGHDQVTLRVTCQDDAEFQKTFANGNAVRFSLRDMPGDQVADGQCTWQAWTSSKLKDNVKKQLDAVRGDAAATRKVLKDNNLSESQYQSGSFLVLGGRIFPVGLTENSAARSVGTSSVDPSSTTGSGSNAGSRVSPGFGRNLDPAIQAQVIADDLIVQGSECLGIDCTATESFGFDTLRLKENNLRIKAEDTSTTSGFPTTDWQITFNDSASGGLNKFSVDDVTNVKTPFTVEANAPTNSLYVDSQGDIGIQQSAPILDIHITTGDTPAMRYEQTNASGFTAQTWDIGANEANFFVRDVTGGSRLSFRIRPGAPTSSIDIAGDGDVGFSVANPNANTRIDVNDTTQTKARVAFTGQEFFQTGNTSADGIALLLGVNRTGNRQLWMGDTSALTPNATNRVIRFAPNQGDISALGTDGTTNQNMTLQLTGGSVGIGAQPSSKLHVTNGDIRVTNGSFIDDGTTLSVPDYVFESDYRLMPIEKVAEFIREFKHLPSVPSASEIAAGGLNMSQMQMRLLEKVEELTLYTIAQHEQIGSLKGQNEQLQDRLKALENKLAQNQ